MNSIEFGIVDNVFFAIVLMVGLGGGFFHTYMVTKRRSSPKRSGVSGANTPESCNSNHMKRGSDRDGHGNHSGSFQAEDSPFLEAGRSLARSKNSKRPRGLALLSRTNQGITKLSDILYLVTCYSSICVVLGFATHVYDHGVAFVLASVPAILTAHLVAVGIVNPVVYKYNSHHSSSTNNSLLMDRTRANRNSNNFLSPLNYIHRRFGDNGKSNAVSTLTFVAATCAISLWVVFTVSTAGLSILKRPLEPWSSRL